MIIESVEEPIKNATVNESCEELDAGILGKQVEFTKFILIHEKVIQKRERAHFRCFITLYIIIAPINAQTRRRIKRLNLLELGKCTNDNFVGSECRFTCPEGYRLVSEKVSTCTEELDWTVADNDLPGW